MTYAIVVKVEVQNLLPGYNENNNKNKECYKIKPFPSQLLRLL